MESLKTSASLGEICKPWKLPGVLCIPNTLQQFSESFKGHTTVILNHPTLPALDYILAQHISRKNISGEIRCTQVGFTFL